MFFVIGITAFALLTLYLLLRHFGMLTRHTEQVTIITESSPNIPPPPPPVLVLDYDGLPPWSELFEQTKHEIIIHGITLESLNHERTTIEASRKTT